MKGTGRGNPARAGRFACSGGSNFRRHICTSYSSIDKQDAVQKINCRPDNINCHPENRSWHSQTGLALARPGMSSH
jgi:hypothetical protein